jgi:hypothetical protein
MRAIHLSCFIVLTCATVAGAGQMRSALPNDSDPAKTYIVEMRAKPWSTIFEWLTDQTGMPFVSKYPPPPGTFNFISQKGRRYTLGELIDLINDGLAAHRYVLLRSPTCFRLIPADERIDKTLLPHVRLDELPARGHSEYVEVVLPLRLLSADEYAFEVKKMMGPFGDVVVLRQGNRLLLHDTAGSLRRILSLTKDMDESDTRTFTLERYSATNAAELLRRVIVETINNPVELKTPGRARP